MILMNRKIDWSLPIWHTRQLFQPYPISSFQRCLRILVPKSVRVFSGSFLLGSPLQAAGTRKKYLIFILSTLCLPKSYWYLLSDTVFFFFLHPWGFRFLDVFNILWKTDNVLHYNWATWSYFLAVPTQFSLLQYIWKKLQMMERSLLKLESWTW